MLGRQLRDRQREDGVEHRGRDVGEGHSDLREVEHPGEVGEGDPQEFEAA